MEYSTLFTTDTILLKRQQTFRDERCNRIDTLYVTKYYAGRTLIIMIIIAVIIAVTVNYGPLIKIFIDRQTCELYSQLLVALIVANNECCRAKRGRQST